MNNIDLSKIIIIPITLIILFILTGCTKTGKVQSPIDIIQDVFPNKSRYLPNEKIELNINLYNKYEHEEIGKVKVTLKHINQIILELDEKEVTIPSKERQNLSIEFDAPNIDFKGYMVEVTYSSEDSSDLETTAIDVSSDWSKFPRYGYLVNYNLKSEASIQQIMLNLNKYHINGLQFYDWQYKHHQPVPYNENGELLSQWLEIANRPVYAKTVKDYINEAHKFNMMAMNYNLLFGTYEFPETEGVNLDWGLYKDNQGNEIDFHGLPNDWQTSKILLMDPKNSVWQNYIFNQEKIAFEEFDFDGWHVDQLGDRGTRYDKEGNTVNLIDGYVDLLNNAKQSLDTRIVFNAVDGYSQDSIATSVDVDFLYTEVWTYQTYGQLKSIIDAGFNKTDNEKSMILAAYMNYKSSNKPGYFNTPAILLTDATIFASGGAHLELGDTGMLSSEYFPNENLKMSIDLQQALRNYYSFMVAYQNLLRDNVKNVARTVVIEDEKVSKIGNRDTIWAFSKQSGNYEMLHLINLLDNNNDWRDDLKTKKVPPLKENLVVKYYIDKEVEKVMVASPDINEGQIKELSFTTKTDTKGEYITFTLPSLLYWDMVIIQSK